MIASQDFPFAFLSGIYYTSNRIHSIAHFLPFRESGHVNRHQNRIDWVK